MASSHYHRKGYLVILLSVYWCGLFIISIKISNDKTLEILPFGKFIDLVHIDIYNRLETLNLGLKKDIISCIIVTISAMNLVFLATKPYSVSKYLKRQETVKRILYWCHWNHIYVVKMCILKNGIWFQLLLLLQVNDDLIDTYIFH